MGEYNAYPARAVCTPAAVRGIMLIQLVQFVRRQRRGVYCLCSSCSLYAGSREGYNAYPARAVWTAAKTQTRIQKNDGFTFIEMIEVFLLFKVLKYVVAPCEFSSREREPSVNKC